MAPMCLVVAMAGLERGGLFTPNPKLTPPSQRRSLVCPCNKMFVPGFGEKTPEAKTADTMHNFFTYVAVKIVLAQLEDYNKEAYVDLMQFVENVPLKDGDKFCSRLMRESSRHKGLALRILEVRAAYASADFEWDNVKKLSLQKIKSSNTKLMRDFLAETTGVE